MRKSYSRTRLWFDRLLSKSLVKQFAALGVILFGLFLLSWVFLHISGCEWEDFARDSKAPEWLLPLYLLIDTNAFNNLYINGVHGWALLVSSITFVIGAFIFNGAIIGLITNFIGQRVSNYREGHTHYLKSGHHIIMGYDDMVPSIISYLFEKDKNSFILLLSAHDSENLREKLKKTFGEKELNRIIINYGHRTSADYYKDIHLEAADSVYIVGQRSIPSHDAINVECVDSICYYLEQPSVSGRPKRITCVFEDLDTYAAFKTSEIFDRVGNLGIEFVPYNFYAGWAKQVLFRQSYKDYDGSGEENGYPAVYGKGIADGDNESLTEKDTRYAHLVFVGTTNFAVAFAMEAAHILHFPNGPDVKTRITFIDKNADEEKAEFIIRNRHYFEIQQYFYSDLSNGDEKLKEKQGLRNEFVYFNRKNGYLKNDANFLDVEFEFIKGNVFSKEVQELISDWGKEHNEKQYLSIFMAMSNQRQNFVLGMNMPESVYANGVPIFIRQDHSDNFVSNLRRADERVRGKMKGNTYFYLEDNALKQKSPLGGRYANIYPFGMDDTAFCADETSLKAAKLINYLYNRMPLTDGIISQNGSMLSSMSDEQIWTEANECWRGLTVALKWSNLYNAYSLRVKLAALRSIRGLMPDDVSQDMKQLTESEINVLARVEHNRWNVEKLLMGYRKPHKDEDKYECDCEELKKELERNKNRFIHHDIRPSEQLDGVREIDREFTRYIPWIIKMVETR